MVLSCAVFCAPASGGRLLRGRRRRRRRHLPSVDATAEAEAVAGAGSGEASVAGAPGDWPLLTTWLTTMDGSEVVRDEEALLEHQHA